MTKRKTKYVGSTPAQEDQAHGAEVREVAQNFIDREERFKNALGMMMGTGRNILLDKRRQRGTANIEHQGLQGIVTRISQDKLERVKRFAENQALRKMLEARGATEEEMRKFAGMDASLHALGGEASGVEDDLLDIANYCYIALALLKGVW